MLVAAQSQPTLPSKSPRQFSTFFGSHSAGEQQASGQDDGDQQHAAANVVLQIDDVLWFHDSQINRTTKAMQEKKHHQTKKKSGGRQSPARQTMTNRNQSHSFLSVSSSQPRL